MPRPLKFLFRVTVALFVPLGSPLLTLPLSLEALPAQAQTAQESLAEAVRLHQEGNQQLSQGQFQEALETFQKILVITRQVGDKAGEAMTLNDIGFVYASLSQYPKVLEFYQQALAIRREMGDKAMEGNTLNNMGSVYNDLGEYAKALEIYQQALAIYTEVGDKTKEVIVFNNIGQVYDNLGSNPKALEFYQQALAIAKEVGDQEGEGVILNNMGSAYGHLGEYARALEIYQQALAMRREIGDKAGEVRTLNAIGAVYHNLGQDTKSLEFYQQALVITKEVGDQEGEGQALNNIASVYDILGQYPKALELYQQALAMTRKVGNKEEEFTPLVNIASIYENLDDYAKALEFYQQALAMTRKVGDKAREGAALSGIGIVNLLTGKFAAATENLLAAINVLEPLRYRLTDADKVSIFDIQSSLYPLLQKALIAQNKTEAALEISERSRARALVELLASRLSSNLTAQPTTSPPTIEQIQQIAKEQKATLVEYAIVESESEGKKQVLEPTINIWVVKPTGEIAFRQADLKSLKSSLENLVISSRDSIGVRNLPIIGIVPRPGFQQRQEANLTEQLQQLHQLLIEPIADLLPTDAGAHVVFMPQGELFLVPFPALLDKQGKYLIEKHTILTAPSIQVLELTHEQRQKRGSGELRMGSENALVVGNPTMPSVPPKPEEKPQQLPSLPGAETEAKAIAEVLHTKPLIGNQATKSTVEQLMSKARIIHLATHGLLDDVRGLGSAIALAPDSSYKEEIGKVNGLLTAEEILGLKLNAELVVLSACNTGRGKITGDGVIGLSRSLISAGVPSVLVSLWSVPDAPTAQLMTEFYQNLQKNPDKAQALRQAMLTILKNNRNTPKNWAAFTLIGESN